MNNAFFCFAMLRKSAAGIGDVGPVRSVPVDI
jgi:hypothetical protein